MNVFEILIYVSFDHFYLCTLTRIEEKFHIFIMLSFTVDLYHSMISPEGVSTCHNRISTRSQQVSRYMANCKSERGHKTMFLRSSCKNMYIKNVEMCSCISFTIFYFNDLFSICSLGISLRRFLIGNLNNCSYHRHWGHHKITLMTRFM